MNFDINYKNHDFVYTPWRTGAVRFICNKCNAIALLYNEKYFIKYFSTSKYIINNHLTCEEVMIKCLIE